MPAGSTFLQVILRDAACVGGLGALVIVGLLSGSVSVRGLLNRKTSDGLGPLSPERIQLLILTLGAAATYLTKLSGLTDFSRLPEFDTAWVGVASAKQWRRARPRRIGIPQ